MSSPNRVRGFSYEREVRDEFRANGFTSDRCWGSDGRSRGLPQDVDLVVETGARERHYQLKRRKRVPLWLRMDEHLDGVIYRADREKSFVAIPLKRYLELLTMEERDVGRTVD